MAVSSIVLNGTIGQTNDVLINHNKEAGKAALDQGHIVHEEKLHNQEKAQKVMNSEESRYQESRYDSKEKGHGSYQGDGGRNRTPQKKEGQIINKVKGGFDVKI